MRSVIRKKAAAGFTLVELMIVVAIVGILAVLAIYGVRKYIANAKTTEARNSLGQIAKDASTAYEKETMAGTIMAAGGVTGVMRSLCATGTGQASVPGTITLIGGQKYQSSKLDWANAADVTANIGWPCLRYSMDAPQYYQYNYVGTAGGAAGSAFTASAFGDLNGDANYSTFSITGSISTTFILNTAPNILEVSPDE